MYANNCIYKCVYVYAKCLPIQSIICFCACSFATKSHNASQMSFVLYTYIHTYKSCNCILVANIHTYACRSSSLQLSRCKPVSCFIFYFCVFLLVCSACIFLFVKQISLSARDYEKTSVQCEIVFCIYFFFYRRYICAQLYIT